MRTMPTTAYIEMGSPKELTSAEVAHLNELTRDIPETDKAMRSSSDGTIGFRSNEQQRHLCSSSWAPAGPTSS